LLLGVNLGSAYIAMGGLNVTVNLGVAVVQTLLVLFVLSLADYLSRMPLPAPW
jgi:hypothetical protein